MQTVREPQALARPAGLCPLSFPSGPHNPCAICLRAEPADPHTLDMRSWPSLLALSSTAGAPGQQKQLGPALRVAVRATPTRGSSIHQDGSPLGPFPAAVPRPLLESEVALLPCMGCKLPPSARHPAKSQACRVSRHSQPRPDACWQGWRVGAAGQPAETASTAASNATEAGPHRQRGPLSMVLKQNPEPQSHLAWPRLRTFFTPLPSSP